MRVELEHLDARGLSVDLSTSKTHVEQRVRVREAVALSGILEQLQGVTRLEQVTAGRLLLDTLALVFGSVLLREQGVATLEETRVTLEQDAQHTAFDLEATSVHATSLSVDVGTVHVRGETRMSNMCLWVRDGEGRLDAAHLTIGQLRVRLGKLSISAPHLSAERVRMAWGADGFRLEAAMVGTNKIELSTGGLQVHGDGLVVRALRVHGSDVSVGSAELSEGRVDYGFDAAPSETTEKAVPPPATERPKLLDYSLLDRLSGELNVDAAVDMSVPVLGRRRATHRLRLGIEDGNIDYRELEAGLSGLEESLLDFSVRSGSSALVLELGIPLLPTRGLGKPLVVWDLSSEDLKLAERRRVKLSVLPTYRLAGQERRSEPPRDPDASSSFALRSLDLENIDVRLALEVTPQPLEGAIRFLSFQRIEAQGAVHHDTQEGAGPQEGGIVAQVAALDLSIAGLPVGSSILDLARLHLTELSKARLAFAGLKPTRLEAELKHLVLGATQLRG